MYMPPPLRRLALGLAATSALAAAGGFVMISVPATALTPAAAAATPSDTSFASVKVGAGGFVTGMSMSDDGSTRVVRTDGFGGYRWDAGSDQWVLDVSADTLPAADVSPGLGGGQLEVAVAPSDGSRVYMAYNDSVYRSDDGAQTWTSVLQGVAIEPGADLLATGPRIVVDPLDPDVVYYGAQGQTVGLLESRDGGATWASSSSAAKVPAGITPPERIDQPKDKRSKSGVGAGVNALAIDRNGGVVDGRSRVVYAASFGNGVYRSDDGGNTWTQIGGTDLALVRHMVILGNGDLLVVSRSDLADQSGPNDVYRYHDGAWSLSGPSTASRWSAVAVDPTTPGRVALMAQGGTLALSDDDGATWATVKRTMSSVGDVPWLAWSFGGNSTSITVGDLEFDPAQPGRLWLTEGTGVWYADLAVASIVPASVLWNSQSRGIEQLVPTDVIAAPGGKPVFSAWDRPIFRSEDPTKYPTTYGPVNQFGAAWSLDWSVSDPNYLVADVASQQAPYNPSTSGYSTDGGKTWIPFPTIPLNSTNAVSTFGFGSMAVSTPGNVVWVPSYGRQPMYTKDGGQTWQQVSLPGVVDYAQISNQAYYVNRRVIAADKSIAGTFYLFVNKIGTFRSTDGGDSWTQMSDASVTRNTNYGYAVTLKATPGQQGDLFMTPGRLAGPQTSPFLHSTDGGSNWTSVPGLTSVSAFGFGAPMSGSTQETVFAAGYLYGVYGIYRSSDGGGSWTYLSTYAAARTGSIVAIDGDKDIPGRVYLGVGGGNGWVYGSLTPGDTGVTPPPSSPPTDTPTDTPTDAPTIGPTPTSLPTTTPTAAPTTTPTAVPTTTPTTVPTTDPTVVSTPTTTTQPVSNPTVSMSAPETVRPGKWFDVSATVSATITGIEVRWSMSGCQIADAGSLRTKIKCATAAETKRLKVRVSGPNVPVVRSMEKIEVAASKAQSNHRQSLH